MPKLHYARWLLLSFLVIVLDQLSKWYAVAHLQLQIPVEVNPYFNWYLDYNHGAAWSFLADESGWQRWVLSGFSAVISVVILFLLKRSSPQHKAANTGLALILGGAIGNLIERIHPGVVTDFIQWHIGNHYWPTFNLADSAVCIGAVIYIWGIK
ncbi:MAG: signal peptidase II [Gammaproteobacteria bacterium]|nr:signal peptidase II [Gammaproteobacteria bacterium]